MQFLLERKGKILDTLCMPPFNTDDNGKMTNTEQSTENGLIVSKAQTAHGKEVVIYYAPETTLTLVYDYVPGRSLIFEGNVVDGLTDGKITEKALAGCLIENHILGEKSVVDIWAEMKASQVKK